jgi:hypothetical protein
VIDQLFIIPTIAVLSIGRLWYLRAHSVQRDVRDAILPLSSRLHAADFFRRPRSEDVRFAFWIVQYGVIWYAINLPLMRLARFEGRKWTYALCLLDVIFVWFSFNLGLVGALIYITLNTINLFKAPWNVSIFWLIVLGVFSWVFLVLAPIAKLPIGIPTKVWGHVRQALFYQKNPYYYGLLGLFWIFVAWRTLVPWFLAGTWLGQIASFQP